MSDTNETILQRQVRLIMEQQCRDVARLLTAELPAGVGFALWIFDFGHAGNTAYVASAQREDVIRLVQDWLDRQDANHPAEGWQTAALFLQEVSRAIGFEGDMDREAVIARCRELAEKETTR